MDEGRRATKRTGQLAATPKPSRAEARRHALLEAAAVEFLSHGFQGASVANITVRAKGSTATVYRQFGGKAGLFTAVANEERRLLDGMLDHHDFASETLGHGLRQFGRFYVDALLSERAVAFVRLAIAEAARFPELQIAFRSGNSGVIAKLAAFIAAKSDESGLGIPDARSAAEMFVYTLRGRVYGADSLNRDFAVSAELSDFIERTARYFEMAHGLAEHTA